MDMCDYSCVSNGKNRRGTYYTALVLHSIDVAFDDRSGRRMSDILSAILAASRNLGR